MSKTASGLSLKQLKSTNAAVVDQSLAAYWSPLVRRQLASSVEGIVGTGQVLIDAKANCAHGEFGKLFDLEDSQYVGIGIRMGQMFMAVGSHETLSNANHGSHLPPSWRTLYELSRFEPTQVETWIAEGLITPETERKQLRALGRGDGQPKAPAPLPAGLFDVLLADPPWRYDHPISDSREIENQYETMEVEDIAALEVPAADDSVLFLWATVPMNAKALWVMDAWGFEYRTGLVWVKDRIGMGYWTRSRHELLLVGIRGEPLVPEAANKPDSVISAPRGKHSEKPSASYELIETAFPGHSYCELFARKARPGWTSWGNEL